MAVSVTTGKNKGVKRSKGRFGGNSAWKQHQGDEKLDKASIVSFRRRADSRHVQALMSDLGDFDDVRPSTQRCSTTGIAAPVLNGIVREGNIMLVFAQGKLLSAHCG